MELPSLSIAKVSGRRVVIRCDFDVPLRDGKVEDETRLVSVVSTIEYLLEQGANVIAIGHIGRPKEHEEELSTKVIADWFGEVLGRQVSRGRVGNFDTWQLGDYLQILENLRFHRGEEENDPSFAQELSKLGDIYVNEAFGATHRSHASIVGLPAILPHFAGFHLLKEVKVLGNLLEDPKRPLTVIVGGAKIETKLPLISKMHSFADFILVGGEIAEQDEVLIKEQHEKKEGQKGALLVADLTSEKLDVTPKSIENFSQIIERSKTVIWNGPMGYVEKGNVESTVSLANEIIASGAYKVVGGGDTISVLSKHSLKEKFDFVSVGGGAMLTFLSGEDLPGLIALQRLN